MGWDVAQHPAKVIQGVMHTFVEGNPTLDLLGEDMLHEAEGVMGARECKCHGTKLS